tara:strand:- start:509 stop:1678 length:1170 start_codon:yes stop_codon:yes gene_type:complete
VIRVAILGSTGSIGCSALEVIRRHPEYYNVTMLAANRNVDALAAQVSEFRPKKAVICDLSPELPTANESTRWERGIESVLQAVADPDVDIVINALVGAVGLRPTLTALEAGHRVALANKESLVTGGALVVAAAESGEGEVIPIDSEHSAILQCLQGSDEKDLQRITLTASGGPFRGCSKADLYKVKATEALRHPTWNMGAKITVDSATLANKALEVIEAHFLYGLDYDRIEAVVHPQSVIHSFVEFVDGSVLAQLGFPNMELPILYALSYPHRLDDALLRTYDPVRLSPLTFEDIDHEAFPMYALGVEAGRRSGYAPAVYNAGNEIAVEAFLGDRIRFPEMPEVVERTMDRIGIGVPRDLMDVISVDQEARKVSAEEVARCAQSIGKKS